MKKKTRLLQKRKAHIVVEKHSQAFGSLKIGDVFRS